MQKTITRSQGRLEITLSLQRLGSDVQVMIWGGDAHIGAVAVAGPHTLLPSQQSSESQVEVISVPGHKDDVVASAAATHLARAFNKTVAVTVGLHWDNLTPEEIDKVLSLCHELTREGEQWLRSKVEKA